MANLIVLSHLCDYFSPPAAVARACKCCDYTQSMISVSHAANLFLDQTFTYFLVHDFEAKNSATKSHLTLAGEQYFCHLFSRSTMFASV